MGMDLFNEKDDYFRFSRVGWLNVLKLAQLYGWRPLGTTQPERWGMRKDNLAWPETYDVNQGQSVTKTDAAALAAAIQDALDDIPDVLDVPKYVELPIESHPLAVVIGEIEADLGEKATSFIGPDSDLTPFEFFGGEDKRKLVEFVEFCRRGGFRIF